MTMFERPLPQPDQRSCGAAVAVVAAMLRDPALAARVAEQPDGFAAEVLRRHRELTGPVDGRGRAQLPWPRALGTPPWALARALSGEHADYASRVVWPHRRERMLARIRGAVGATRPVPLYVGARWAPRHVVLVLDSDLTTYEPARGGLVSLTPDAFVAGRLTDATSWPVQWFALLPRT